MWINAKSLFTTGLIAVTITGAAMATAPQAEARNRFGVGLAAGAVGGALLAGALDRPVYAAPVYPSTVYEPVYPPVVEAYPACRTVWHQNAWGDMYRTRSCN
ncbi:hypothetical protein [Rhizobium sp. NFR03]|uniref:hypothetical protein n=1 Tax=Rhizobium sp. NFR03 TaxID=1566263 RepID=UPI0008D5C083|nr:hypothetical protein [Rhizobium sp. NFR03]SES40963.1 hypothetical protein SAMN03159406_04104 [Rhizobium sp. NFR03]